jgi:hypothetical protein
MPDERCCFAMLVICECLFFTLSMQQNDTVDGPFLAYSASLHCCALQIFLSLKQHAIIVGLDAIGFSPVICIVLLMSLS